MSQREQQEQLAQTQTESRAASAAHQVGIEAQSRDVHDRKHNPQFYDKFTESSLKNQREVGAPAQRARRLAR